MHFGGHILLAISTTSCPFLEIQNILETLHSSKYNRLLRIQWQRVLAILIFKMDDWNQIHFCRHILLATISLTSSPFLDFQNVLETLHLGKFDCLRKSLLKIRWRCVLAIVIVKLDDWNQMHFGQHILLTTLYPFLEIQSVLKTCILATAIVPSEFGGNMMHFNQHFVVALQQRGQHM